ncbi:MAG: hypothetical protein IJS54_06515 [Desulfovibrio sp.]|nr:hypothetical protein [Desulfovibrio sp.]
MTSLEAVTNDTAFDQRIQAIQENDTSLDQNAARADLLLLALQEGSSPNLLHYLKIADTLSHMGFISDAHYLCQEICANTPDASPTLPHYLKIADTLKILGFASDAQYLYQQILQKNTAQDIVNSLTKRQALFLLGVIANDMGDHKNADTIDQELLRLFPDNQEVWIYLLRHASDNPAKTPADCKALAERWAKTIPIPRSHRPKARLHPDTPLRIGYVSGNFALHPVGLFLSGVLLAHDTQRVQIFAYNTAESTENPIEAIAKQCCTLRSVSSLNDDQLEAQIRADNIDVLVDLSGFTTNTRLPVFAREPAPVLLSWLGYWGTTGLSCFDGVLMDAWHAPEGTEADFVEPIVRLPNIRFCYQPLTEEPACAPNPPCVENGFITFGCFNHTHKLNDDVIDVWANILKQLPSSRLLLKWKTLRDRTLREHFCLAFELRGIDPQRILFSGWSSIHAMLEEYAKVDIALDPFPFGGGMTSCNALWMGVPLVTLSGNSPIGRQGEAILSQIDLRELVAKSKEDYCSIALGLAANTDLLIALRQRLRLMMQASPLMDVDTFTRNLETTYETLFEKRARMDA